MIYCEDVNRGPYPTTISLFANAVFILAALVLLNSLVRRILPRVSLSQAELLVVYTMVCVGASLSGLDMIAVLMQVTTHPYRFATPDNQWMSLFGKYLPNWLIIHDTEAVRGYFEGHSSLYTQSHIRIWIGPVLWWTGFLMALLFVMSCINTLVPRQWVDRERLTFPIIQLPMSMTEPNGKLWRNKLMWAGLAIAGGIDLLNGLAYYYPSIPIIPVKHTDMSYLFTVKPWNAMGWTPYSFYPFVIGLGFLLPADLSFSGWFFYIYRKLQVVTARAVAWDALPEFPYVKQQCFGAHTAVLVTLLWSARGLFEGSLAAHNRAEIRVGRFREAMSFRTAAVGAAIGIVLLTAFAWRLGLSPLIGLTAFAIYFAAAVAITRMRAELGPPVHDLHFSGPDVIITQFAGTHGLNAQDLTGLNLFYGFNRAYRGHPMPIGIESMKMSQESRGTQKAFLAAFLIAALVGSLSAFRTYLHLAYTRGTAAGFSSGIWFGREAYSRLEGWMRNPLPADASASIATVTGFACALFLGLILGQMIVGPAWTLVAIALKIPAYSFWGG